MPPKLYGGGIWLANAFNAPGVTCDRCGTSIGSENLQHYHCLSCTNTGGYNICSACASNGIYCSNDTHSWTKRRLELGKFMEVGNTITPDDARKIGQQYPSTFIPPKSTDTPQSLFQDEHRFIRETDPREILIFTDGACLENGQANPQGGFAFVYRPSAYSVTGDLIYAGTTCNRLEDRGPTGVVYKHTSNRAELRAVIAALQFRDWSADCNRGWRSVVVATVSEYVALNATERTQRWEAAGWMNYNRRTQKSFAVKNQDLWKLLLSEIRKLHNDGVNVSFWKIPREWNDRADTFAKTGAGFSENAHFRILRSNGPVGISYVQP